MPKGKHSKHARGKAHYRSNPLGVGVNANGYVKIKVGKSHPMADPNGWCYLHRLVAVAGLGRPLAAGEVVHHCNEDKADNRWENLEITSRAEHNAHHNSDRERDEVGRFKAGRELSGRTWDEIPAVSK